MLKIPKWKKNLEQWNGFGKYLFKVDVGKFS
jgi:hypothetical protein